LSLLVIDQGTILDSVEYNVEMAAVSMGEAVRELGEATRYVHVGSWVVALPTMMDLFSAFHSHAPYYLLIFRWQVPKKHEPATMYIPPHVDYSGTRVGAGV
jgi:hypothetical protein